MTLLYEISDFFYDIYFFIVRLLRGTYTEKVLLHTWNLFTELWQYVVIGAFAAVLVSQLMSHRKIRKFLTRKGSVPILFAATMGVLSPMCTFAAIPLTGGLMAAGVPLPPLMAFLIASPLINPSLFIVTWGVMGPQMALARFVSAFALAIAGGWITELALSREWGQFTDPLTTGFTSCGSLPSYAEAGVTWTRREKALRFLKDSLNMTTFISEYFLLALVLAGVVQTFVSPRWIAALLGGSGFKSILIGGMLGIPFYVCGGGTVALIGVLVNMGMGQGAALAFFITGPATKISTIISLHAVLRRNVALVYLAVTLVGGVLIGYGYSKVAPDLNIDSRYYGIVETIEDAVTYKPGIGAPQDWY